MTFIIGISSFYHDSSVSIVKDNILIDYLKEESFTRVKGTNIFPKRALSHLVKKYDLSNSNVDACVFYEKPFLSWSSITLFSLAKPFLRWKISSNQFKKLWTGSLSFSSYTKKLLKIDDKKHLYAAHHMSHALTAISFDKFKDNKDRLIFVIDAVGDGETISIFKNRNNKFFKIFVESFPNSIGLFYSAVTDYLGYSINEGEYKVMGLASYGNPIHKDYIHENIISWKDEKLFFNPDWFDFDKNPEKTYSVKFEKYFGKIPQKKDFSNQRSSEFKKLANIASSFQIVLEEILQNMVSWAIKKTGITNVYFSGGVALNSKAMHKIASMYNVKKFTIPPSPSDTGASIGAASFGNYILNKNFLIKTPLFYSNNFFNPKSNILSNLFKEIQFKDFYDYISKLISKNEYICTFVNGAEIGPRSLGHRSILCSAKNIKIKDHLNIKIKGRENFRPLAPVLMRENLSKYFNFEKKYVHNLEWMGMTLASKKITEKKYPSCIHIDKTSRVQIVGNKSLFLYKLLKKLKKYNHDLILNTSFNYAGDPIVFDYLDCYTSMKKMKLKYLVTENKIFLIK